MRNIKLDKETFIKLMTFVKSWEKFAETKSAAISNILYTRNSFCAKSEIGSVFEEMFCNPEFKDILVDIIIEAMDDTKNEWINYYIYELDWGERNDDLKVYKDDNKTEIPLTTIEDLWNLLVSEKIN